MPSQFSFFCNGSLIGFSDLEQANPSTYVVCGIFRPAEGYAVIEPLCQELSALGFELSQHRESPEDRRRIFAVLAGLKSWWDALDLSLVALDGCAVKTGRIDVADFSPMCGETTIDVFVQVGAGKVWDEFFAGSVKLLVPSDPHV